MTSFPFGCEKMFMWLKHRITASIMSKMQKVYILKAAVHGLWVWQTAIICTVGSFKPQKALSCMDIVYILWEILWYKFCLVCYGFVMQCINLSSANQIKSIMIRPFFVFFPAMQNVLLFYGWQLYSTVYTHHTVLHIHNPYMIYHHDMYLSMYLFVFSNL